MNEKQRWLLKDLSDWQRKQMDKIGTYGPHKEPRVPTRVAAARRSIEKHQATIRQWETEKRAPWQKQKNAIDAKYQAVKRAVLFEKTEVALKALKALVGK